MEDNNNKEICGGMLIGFLISVFFLVLSIL